MKILKSEQIAEDVWKLYFKDGRWKRLHDLGCEVYIKMIIRDVAAKIINEKIVTEEDIKWAERYLKEARFKSTKWQV